MRKLLAVVLLAGMTGLVAGCPRPPVTELEGTWTGVDGRAVFHRNTVKVELTSAQRLDLKTTYTEVPATLKIRGLFELDMTGEPKQMLVEIEDYCVDIDTSDLSCAEKLAVAGFQAGILMSKLVLKLALNYVPITVDYVLDGDELRLEELHVPFIPNVTFPHAVRLHGSS